MSHLFPHLQVRKPRPRTTHNWKQPAEEPHVPASWAPATVPARAQPPPWDSGRQQQQIQAEDDCHLQAPLLSFEGNKFPHQIRRWASEPLPTRAVPFKCPNAITLGTRLDSASSSLPPPHRLPLASPRKQVVQLGPSWPALERGEGHCACRLPSLTAPGMGGAPASDCPTPAPRHGLQAPPTLPGRCRGSSTSGSLQVAPQRPPHKHPGHRLLPQGKHCLAFPRVPWAVRKLAQGRRAFSRGSLGSHSSRPRPHATPGVPAHPQALAHCPGTPRVLVGGAGVDSSSP